MHLTVACMYIWCLYGCSSGSVATFKISMHAHVVIGEEKVQSISKFMTETITAQATHDMHRYNLTVSKGDNIIWL